MLTLPIKKVWFDMISNYDKDDEYRVTKAYYIKRFSKLFEVSEKYLIDMINLSTSRNETIVLKCKSKKLCLRNGYSMKSPSMIVKVKLIIGQGIEEWGAELNETYFVLKVLEIIAIDHHTS